MDFLNESKLVMGNIPANTECPYRTECNPGISCHHQGVNHSCEFSCAFARLYDLTQRRGIKLKKGN